MADNGVGAYHHAMEKQLKETKERLEYYIAMVDVYEDIAEKQAKLIKLLKGRQKLND